MNRDGLTPPLGLEYISEAANIKKGSVKTSIHRLITKKMIKRAAHKEGRGGWIQLMITERIYQELFNLEMSGNLSYNNGHIYSQPNAYWTHIEHKPFTKTDTKPNTKDSIVVSSNNITTTLPSVDVSLLSEIGLTHDHIDQLVKQQKLSLEQIQESINYFAFDLARNDKVKTIKKTPLDYFMGILRQGIPYAPPSNYESPETEAMRAYLESKAKMKQLDKQLEKEVKENLCQEWLEELSESELMEFYVPGESLGSVPEKVRITLKKRNAINHAQQYFESEIWPSKRKEVLAHKIKKCEANRDVS